MEEKLIIPIDERIEAFRHHLDVHDRTILSARFGDGKSFFLSHFMADEDVAKNYTFLTIFPVNYQVAENRDIFELLKRDILLQMFMNGIIEPEDDLSDADALALYLQNQSISFLESFIPVLSSFDIPENYAKAATAAKVCKTLYDKIKSKVDKYKIRENNALVEAFFEEIEKNPIVGFDAISRIIKEGIEKYKDKNKGKKVVLVVEDMDRIDPAHLFRILNVLSAHIDYCYRLGIQPNDTLTGNKFGFDKIILVLHYVNLEKIYSHFYGDKESFLGYMDKFCSSNIFEYSLQAERERLVYDQISKNTGMPQDCVKRLLKADEINSTSIRQIVKAIDETEKFIIKLPKIKSRKAQVISFHKSPLMMIAILRRMGIDEYEIQERIFESMRSDSPISILPYIVPYLSFLSKKNAYSHFRLFTNNNVGNYVRVNELNENGTAVVTMQRELNDDPNADNKIRAAIRQMMQLVSY